MNKVHFGTMGWSYSFWMGNFYPQGTKSSEFLREYAKHFDTVEADNTFYKVPSVEVLENWSRQTPPGFVFSLKLPRLITHRKMLKDCEEDLRFFLERVTELGNKLGPLLIQLPPFFGPERKNVLLDFLSDLPQGFRYALEVRNERVFDGGVASALGNKGVALVRSNKSKLESDVSNDFAYIRWEGERSEVDGTLGKVEVDRAKEIKEWAGKIRRFLHETNEVFGYFSKYYTGHPPSDIRLLIESF